MNLAEFEKDYPGLANMVQHWMKNEERTDVELVSAAVAMERNPQPVFFHPNDIQEYCRDNQIIKEAVGEITFIRGIEPENNIHNAVNRERERILKELRLKL